MSPRFDVEKVRADFPILAREVYGKPLTYLDNGASAQKPQVVLDAIQRRMTFKAQTDFIIERQRQWRPIKLLVEAVAYQALLTRLAQRGFDLKRLQPSAQD